jgi:hypothetical protein
MLAERQVERIAEGGGAMQQIRIFIGKEDAPDTMAKEVNGWLASSKVKVVNVFGNMTPQTIIDKGEGNRIMAEGGGRRYAPSDIMLVVVYEQPG